MYKILRKKFLTPAICLMDVLAPRVAQSAQPGQFLIVRAGEKNERIPLTICDYNREEGSVTLPASSAAMRPESPSRMWSGRSVSLPSLYT